MSLAAPHESELLPRLVLLYLAVAYGADHDFGEAERRTVLHLAGRWAPELDADAVAAVIETALVAVRGFDGNVDDLARELGAVLPVSVQRMVLTDLGHIASADGSISREEAGVIARIRAAWAT
jgi:uncharacterized tellurite resistance protein B-like protein